MPEEFGPCHPAVQDVAESVVELDPLRPTTEFRAHWHITDARTLDGHLEVGTVELGRISGVRAATNVSERFDAIGLE